MPLDLSFLICKMGGGCNQRLLPQGVGINYKCVMPSSAKDKHSIS